MNKKNSYYGTTFKIKAYLCNAQNVQFIVSGCPYPFGRYADALGSAASLVEELFVAQKIIKNIKLKCCGI